MADGTILIVDDEPDVCEMMADCLTESGQWTVDYTTEPLRALQQISDGTYDVVVTDLRMPEMDGLELARQAMGICPSLGVVAVTGYASLPSSVQALRTGVVDYLQKPFRKEELHAAVYRAVTRCRNAGIEEAVADTVTHDNAVLASDNDELRKQLELVSRDLTLLQGRLAGHVADLEGRCQTADALEGQRDLAQLQALSVVLLRQTLPGDEHAVVVIDRHPARVVSTARIDDDDVVVNVAEQRVGRGIIRAVMNRGQTALIEDAGESPILGDLADWITCRGSVLLLPLVGGGTVFGVGVVRREETGQAFAPNEVRRALGHCNEMGRAFETALAFRRQQAEIYVALKAMVDQLENRNDASRGHSRRVATWAGRIARQFGLGDDVVERLQMAGNLHDIGKVMVPRRVLDSVGTLCDEDRELLAAHSESGWEMLQPIAFLSDVCNLVRWHHDLGGPTEDTGFEQHILAAAETYDELTHDGPHGEAAGGEEALATMKRDGFEDRVLQALVGVALVGD
jgi:response regulator RpfG family c-di-GMP phosphodiesterase